MAFTIFFQRKRHYTTTMNDMHFMSPDQLQQELGSRLQTLRISRNLDQKTTAEKAGVSEKTLRNLEAGRGSSIETLVRVLKALNSLDGLESLAPKPSVSPLELLRHAGKPRRRVRRSHAEAGRR